MDYPKQNNHIDHIIFLGGVACSLVFFFFFLGKFLNNMMVGRETSQVDTGKKLVILKSNWSKKQPKTWKCQERISPKDLPTATGQMSPRKSHKALNHFIHETEDQGNCKTTTRWSRSFLFQEIDLEVSPNLSPK